MRRGGEGGEGSEGSEMAKGSEEGGKNRPNLNRESVWCASLPIRQTTCAEDIRRAIDSCQESMMI